MERPTVSAIIPLLDEEPTLEELYERLAPVLGAYAGAFEVIFVNDGSADGSLGVLRRLAGRAPHVGVIDLRRNFGKSAALAAGFAAAKGEVLVTLDGDLQDLPEELPRLFERLAAGADMVTGRKRNRRDPWTRRLASRIFNRLVSWITGVEVRDINSGLKVMRREVADEIPLHGELHRFLPVLARAKGFRVAEVGVEHAPRRHGRSRYGWGRYAAGLLDPVTVLLLTRYGKRPLHFFGVIGGALAGVGLLVLAYLTVGWFFGRWIGDRPLLDLGVLCLLLGIQSAFFGLIAEMLVLATGHRDPGYSVRERLPARASLGAVAKEAAGDG